MGSATTGGATAKRKLVHKCHIFLKPHNPATSRDINRSMTSIGNPVNLNSLPSGNAMDHSGEPVHSGEVDLRQRSCRRCLAVFWICPHCDRGNVIAAHSAACPHAGSNDGVPTAVISGVPRDEQIIVTGSASTGIVVGESGSA
jgi:hypothetical protein